MSMNLIVQENDDFYFNGKRNWFQGINLNTAAIYTIGNVYPEREEISIQLYDDENKKTHVILGESLYFKETIQVGRANCSDFCYLDICISNKHLLIDFKEWFKNQSSFIKSYDSIIRKKGFPIILCRIIASFLKEQRHVKIRDLKSKNGTYVFLKPNDPHKLLKDKDFRLSKDLKLNIEAIERIELLEKDTFLSLEERLMKSYKKSIILYDNYLAEDAHLNTNVFNVLTLYISLVKNPDINVKYTLVSNKSKSSIILGKDHEAQISLRPDNLDKFQCEFKLINGEWYIIEYFHEDHKHKTSLSLQTEHNFEMKLGKTTELSLGQYSTLTIKFLNRH